MDFLYRMRLLWSKLKKTVKVKAKFVPCLIYLFTFVFWGKKAKSVLYVLCCRLVCYYDVFVKKQKIQNQSLSSIFFFVGLHIYNLFSLDVWVEFA